MKVVGYSFLPPDFHRPSSASLPGAPQQVLSSVVRTARQRGLDLPPLIAEMLRAREPVVPEAFGLPPPPA